MRSKIERSRKNIKGGDKKVRARSGMLERDQRGALQDKPARSVELTDDEKLLVRDLHLLTMKPCCMQPM